MELKVIHTGMFKLDGGAMFGVVPKSIWNRINPADENNLCTWAMRCLLIVDGDQIILVDNGIGNKQDDKFFGYYYLHGNYSLEGSLKSAGLHPDDITDVFQTHLHFDHCGGGVKYSERQKGHFELTFRHARYWSNRDHWKWATQPNPREKASFLPENIQPIGESGHLHFVDIKKPSPFPSFDIMYADGHTDKQMLPMIHYKGRRIIFAADLLPSAGHVPLPYLMSYDTRPLITLMEKEMFLHEAVEKKYIIFFEHDPETECATLKMTDKGVRIDQTFQLQEIE
ncbi:MAG: MBL fold metallo-hydrolase [Cyclobacteriaceae bacterium]|nr:MBL fold metallo-hydrolase [Cyclobacteriaceae bacterium]